MEIFRVEHREDNRGPYVGYRWDNDVINIDARQSLAVDMSAEHWDEDIHPTPSYSFGRMPYEDEVCGTDSLESLLRWFVGFHDRLHDCGYEIHIYEIDESQVLIGKGNQVLFKKGEAILIEELSILAQHRDYIQLALGM